MLTCFFLSFSDCCQEHGPGGLRIRREAKRSDYSGKAGGSVEISTGGVIGEYTWEDTIGTLQWEAEFTDGVFEGYIWNPELPEFLFREFSLTY